MADGGARGHGSSGGGGAGGGDRGRGRGRSRSGAAPRPQRGPQGGSRQGSRGSRQRPAERARTADASRLAAYTVLRAVDDGAYTNLALPQEITARRLAPRDAAFATELTYGTTRMRGLYDAIIAVASDRPVSEIDAGVLDVLRLGAHQLLGMRVPEHAAVSEAVALARQVCGSGRAAFVNAVLRRVSERTRQEWLALVAPPSMAPIEAAAVTTSHPQWVIGALRAALLGSGGDESELQALLEADNTPSPVHLVARPGLATVAELVAVGATPSRLSSVGAVLPGGDPGAIPAIREGRAAVQDAGSQLVAQALAAAPLGASSGGSSGAAGAHERWLDLCAGPGGKAGLLAALAVQRGAELVANEVSEHRAQLVRQTLRPAIEAAARSGVPQAITVRTGDGRELGELAEQVYDRVLVDAPCTGLGALRRRPEARWRRTPSDVPTLARLQRELLISAVRATRPGGVIGYATCSPHLPETRFVVQDVVKSLAKGRDAPVIDVEILDATQVLREVAGPGLGELAPGPFVQLWPHRHGTDAMFLALLRRR